MKTDWLTKSLLSAIALFLGVIAVNGTGGVGAAAVAQQGQPAQQAQAAQPASQTPPTAQRTFDHLRLSGDANGFYLFDGQSGRIWYYRAADFRARPDEIGQIEEPGGRLSR